MGVGSFVWSKRAAVPLACIFLYACAGPPSEESAVRAVSSAVATQTVVQAASQPGTAQIGTGWSSSAQSLMADCIASDPPIVATPASSVGHIFLDTTWSKSDLEKTFGFETGAKGRYMIASASLAAKAVQATQQDALSISFTYGGEFITKYERIQSSNAKMTVSGQQALEHRAWQEVCGDNYVIERQFGGRFLLTAKFIFESAEAKSHFETNASGGFDAMVGAVSFSTKISSDNNALQSVARLHVEAFQFGGRTQNLTSIAAAWGGKSESETGAVRVFDTCGLDNIQACGALIRRASAYFGETISSNGFAAQLQNDPAPISYIVQPWRDYPAFSRVDFGPAETTKQIEQARTDLSTKFDRIFENFNRINKLLDGGSAMLESKRDELRKWRAVLNFSLKIVNDAVDSCYNNLVFEKGILKPESVTSCTASVTAIEVPIIPDNVIASVGQYAIEAYARHNRSLGTPVGDTFFPVGAGSSYHGIDIPPPVVIIRGGIQPTEDDVGWFQNFVQPGGAPAAVYWSADTGPHEIHGDILAKWLSLGTAPRRNRLGYPTSDQENGEFDAECSHFQRGDIVWSPATGAHVIDGEILKRWNSLGRHFNVDRFTLGLPTSDVLTLANGGAYARFQNGAIYFKKGGVAHPVVGKIYDAWRAASLHQGPLGYPIDDPKQPDRSWVEQAFEHGMVLGAAESDYGYHYLYGKIATRYRELMVDKIGYPLTDQSPRAGGYIVEFIGGANGNAILIQARNNKVYLVEGAIKEFYMNTGGPEKHGFPTMDHAYVDAMGTRVIVQKFERTAIVAAPIGTKEIDFDFANDLLKHREETNDLLKHREAR